MKFAEPIWLLAGLAVCALLALSWRRHDARQRAALARFASKHLHEQLVASFSVVRRRWRRGLFLLSLVFLFAALARPQLGYNWVETKRRGIEILFAIDTSKSMLTPDVKPNRLARAKLAVDDFVSHLNGDGVGLVAFAGTAFLQCPITLDYDAFDESLEAIDTNTIPRGGTDISSAIREAAAALQDRKSQDKILILLTDGEDLEGSAVDTAREAAQSGLKIFTVGVGTASGDLIPLPPENGGGFVKDASGQYVKSHLDESTLKAIAAATGGIYAPLGNQGQGLATIQQALEPMARHELASRRERVYIERYQWPLAASLVLLLGSLLIGTRRNLRRSRPASDAPPVPRLSRRPRARPVVAALAGTLVLASVASARASISDAADAYKKGDFAAAQKEYAAAAQKQPDKTVLQFDAGTAAYKAGQYPDALQDFQKSLGTKQSADPAAIAAQQDAYYNLGNTLYRTGQQTEQADQQKTIQAWQQAVKSYDAALQIRADDADAKFNRDFVQHKLDELQKQQQQQQKQDQQNQQQNQQNQSQQSQSQQNQNQNQQSQQNQSAQNQQNQSGQSGQQNQTAQNQQNQSGKSGQSGQQNQANNQNSQNGSSGQAQNQPNAQKNPGQQQGQQNQTAQNSGNQNQGSKPDQQPGQQQNQQAGNGSQGNQPQPSQPNGQQPGSAQPGNGSSLAQNGGPIDETGHTADEAAPGQMSKKEAGQLLDSLRDEQRNMPGTPIARSGNLSNPDQPPAKDW
jgi:Ca-activated chloride channel family protein